MGEGNDRWGGGKQGITVKILMPFGGVILLSY